MGTGTHQLTNWGEFRSRCLVPFGSGKPLKETTRSVLPQRPTMIGMLSQAYCETTWLATYSSGLTRLPSPLIAFDPVPHPTTRLMGMFCVSGRHGMSHVSHIKPPPS